MRMILAALALAGALSLASAHDHWINHGSFRSPVTNELCCGEGDCFVVAPERIVVTAGGYAIVGPQAGADGHSVPVEVVPFSEAQPSPDGAYWRCKRPDGSRRCFFAPPPST